MSAVLLGNSVVNILSASLTTAVLTALFGAAGIVYATVDRRRPGGDLRRGDAQDLGAAARRPRGADAGALDRRHAWRCWGRWRAPSPGSRASSSGRWACGSIARRDAEEHADVLRGAIELHGHGQADEDAPAEKAMLQLGARSRRPHGRRRHDPSRQRRADRCRRADRLRSSPRCWRRPTPASRSIAAEPDNIDRRRPRQGPVPRRASAAGGPETVKIDEVMTPPWFIPEFDDAVRPARRRSAPATSISPSSSTSTARCAASSPSRTSSRRSSATSRTSTTPSSAAWSGARTAA